MRFIEIVVFLGEKKLSKVITPDVAKTPLYKTPKNLASSADREEVKEGAASSGITGFRRVAESVSVSASHRDEPTIVGSDKRTLSGMNMTLASKSKLK